MVRPHTRNGLLTDGEKNNIMETNGEPMGKKTKNKMAG